VTEEFRSYYGRPVLKEPTWTWEIPVYFFTGGLGGASAMLSLAAEVAGNEKLAKTSRYLAAFGDNVSPFLLISDLGRPERFLNMLRVFKVTSPMSVGSWILVVSGGASTTAAALELLDRWKPLKLAAETVAAFFGGPLSTYTANLISDTSVPVWHEGRHELPFVFGMSAGATAGAASTLFLRPRDAGPARRLAIGAAVAENAAMFAMEKRLGLLAEPYHKGLSGKLSIASKVASLAGATVLARSRKSRTAAVAGSSLVLTGAMLLRWGVFKAGFASARDPKYTIVPQRERDEARQQQV
jgi:formate-dependent nitrite reductase membrane component NrfD